MFNLIPFKSHNEDNLFNYLDNIEKQFFGDFDNDVSISNFRTDIIDEGDKYVLQSELPGFNKEDIKINIKDDMLTISAQHSEEKETKNKNNYLRKERKFGSFSRSFSTNDIDIEKINASYQNGILELEMPKKAIAESKVKKIDIN